MLYPARHRVDACTLIIIWREGLPSLHHAELSTTILCRRRGDLLKRFQQQHETGYGRRGPRPG